MTQKNDDDKIYQLILNKNNSTVKFYLGLAPSINQRPNETIFRKSSKLRTTLKFSKPYT